MRNKNKLILDQLDRKLIPFKELEKINLPEKGWVFTIRKSLNMTLKQLGNKLNITRQGVKKIEESEESGSISLKMLKKIGLAFDMQLVYGFYPNQESINKMVEEKAKKLAVKIVLRTHQNMQLENQGNSQEQINLAIIELANEIKREMRKSLWD